LKIIWGLTDLRNRHDMATYLSIPEAQDLAGVGRTTVYRWIDEGRVRTLRDAPPWLVLRADVVSLVRSPPKRGRPHGAAQQD